MTTTESTNTAIDTLCDLCAGTIAGLNTKVIEYPLDTVKVRLQDTNGSKYTGAIDCLRKAIQEDYRQLYRGMTAPVLGCMFENAILFAFYGRLQELSRHFFHEEGRYSKDPLSILEFALCGAGAGVSVSFILTPIELVKCRMQLQDSLPPERRIYRSTFYCVQHVLRVEGWRTLFGRGLVPTLAREVPGNACWYATYESVKLGLTRVTGITRENLPLYYSAGAGSMAGAMYWTAFFPADVVKTRIQTDASFAKAHSLWTGLIHVYREGGLRSLYAGWGITVARAIPSNAVLFTTYEWVYHTLKKITA